MPRPAGRSTVAPGGTYDVRVAPGRNPGLSPVPGDGRWSVPAAPAEQEPKRTRSRNRPAATLPKTLPPPLNRPLPRLADDSETETIPAAPEGAPASPESEE